jgi:hypothetical protein
MIFKEIDNMKDVGAICHYCLSLGQLVGHYLRANGIFELFSGSKSYVLNIILLVECHAVAKRSLCR